MIFHNAGTLTVRFDLRGNLKYEVPPGAQCDIPAPLAWVVKARGLLLTKGPAPGGNAEQIEPVEAQAGERRLPPGVQSVDFATSDSDAEESDESPTVADAVSKMRDAGIQPPGRKRK